MQVSNPDIWVLGDPHLYGETAWQTAAAGAIIAWVQAHPLNKKTTEVIVLGDLIDRFKALPPTHDLILKFLQSFRTQKIHLLVGNHDIDKLPSNENSGEGQWLAYAYARSLGERFIVYEYPQRFCIGDLQFLALPYYIAPSHCLEDYSSMEALKRRWPDLDLDPDSPIDVVIAHVADLATGLPPGACVDIDELVGAKPFKILGHIHIANKSADRIQYTGSLYSLKIDEKGERYEWMYQNGTWKRKTLPVFCDLLKVKYGDALTPSKHTEALPVYTVYNCPSEERARQMYGQKTLIRKTVSSWDHFRKSDDIDFSQRSASFSLLTKEDLIVRFEQEVLNGTEWAESENIPLTLSALKIIAKQVTSKDSFEANPCATVL